MSFLALLLVIFVVVIIFLGFVNLFSNFRSKIVNFSNDKSYKVGNPKPYD